MIRTVMLLATLIWSASGNAAPAEQTLDGYKGIKWGTPIRQVLAKIPAPPGSYACQRGSTFEFPYELQEFLKARNQGLDTKLRSWRTLPDELDRHQKDTPVGDGC